MPESLPNDPVGQYAENAIGLHVLFTSYLAAGFTEYQACVIIGVFLGTLSKQ